jgi:hypothetical protein
MSGELVPVDPFTLTDEAIARLPDEFEFLLSTGFTDNCASVAQAFAKVRALTRFCTRLHDLGYGYTIDRVPPFTHYRYVFHRVRRLPPVDPSVIDV